MEQLTGSTRSKDQQRSKNQAPDIVRTCKREQTTAAENAVRKAFSGKYPGVPGKYLMAGGNQFLLGLIPNEPQSVPPSELSFADNSPGNDFAPYEPPVNQPIPGHTGQLVNITDVSSIR